jgi:excisionase family DNA binding protein
VTPDPSETRHTQLTVAEAAARLGVSRQFVRDEIRAGALKARLRQRPSGRTLIRIPESSFVEYLAEAWTQR